MFLFKAREGCGKLEDTNSTQLALFARVGAGGLRASFGMANKKYLSEAFGAADDKDLLAGQFLGNFQQYE